MEVSLFYKFFITFFIILFIFTTFFISLNITTSNQNLIYSNYITISSSGFAWPIPGYTKVTSPFEKEIHQLQELLHIIMEQI